jgi:hypothetical protein
MFLCPRFELEGKMEMVRETEILRVVMRGDGDI